MRIFVHLPIFFLLALSSLLPGALGQSSDENTRVLAALGTGATPPVFNAYFPTNPLSVVGGTSLNYAWLQQDANDSSTVAAYHQGLVSLSGSSTAYIDVNTTTGPNSCGVKLPLIIGGPGSGTGATQGWSVDLVVKLTGSSGGWAKLIDFGDGPFNNPGGYPTINDLTITWDGNDNNENGLMEGLAAQQLSSAPPVTLYNYASVPIIKPQLYTWYHIALVMQAVNVTAASATWFIYVNGQLLPYSAGLQAGATLTAFQGANLPLPVQRPQSYIGKSDYGDPDLSAIFDAVRLYDYALTSTQVSALAAAYNLNTGVTLPSTSNNAALPTTSETTYWQNAGISRAPVLNAVFPADPTSSIGGTRLYTWLASDSTDSAAVAAQHPGVIKLSGGTNSFIDLNSPTGPNSIGLVMGTFGGAGGSTGATQGWTVELVVKVQQALPYSKLLTIGNGGYLDDFFIGYDALGQSLYVEISNNVNINLPGVIGGTDVTLNSSVPLNQWVHMAVVMRPTNLTLYSGTIAVYLNGQLVGYSSDPTTTVYPTPVYRDQTYIGASDYQDPNAVATYDAVRVYDQALTQSQVQAMANLYGLQYTAPTADENTRVLAALGAGATPPVFNAYFPTNPLSVVGGTSLNYAWLQQDANDSSTAAAYHQGLVSLSGSPTSYIDVNTTTGPNSCGVKLPLIIGGAGSGTGATQGVSVDLVVKLTGSSGGWAKLIDFGDGPFNSPGGYPTINDLTITWDGNDNNENGLLEGLAVQQLSSAPPVTLYNFGVVPVIKPQLYTWYHIALVMQAVNVSAASATWFVYVNGQLLPYSVGLQSGATLTAFQGANLPLPVQRPQSYIGKSDYGDPDLSAIFDAVRLYDYALTSTQVSALAAAYNLNTGVSLPTTSNNAALPSTAETTYWQNAGISRAPVLNAVFPADPSTSIGATRLYTWSASDSSDSSSVAAQHPGVVQLNGSTNSFVDLTSPTGPNSVGLVVGTFGGPGGSTGSAQGWTVEMVVKPLSSAANSKLLTIGNGAYLDVFFIGYDSQGQSLYVEISNNVNINLPGVIGTTDVTIPVSIPLNQWVHMAVVMQPTSLALYTGTVMVYLNGQLVASSTDPTTTVYPTPVYRDQSYLGASDYQDPNAVATYDAVRVYDQALTGAQVLSMSQQYGLQGLPSQSGGGGSSKLSGGKIAGAVIGSVVGALLLCMLLGYLVVKSRGDGGAKAEAPRANGKTSYGEMDESVTKNSPKAVEMA